MVLDANPWGLGAVLFIGETPKFYIAGPLTAADVSTLGHEIGCASGQQTCEALVSQSESQASTQRSVARGREQENELRRAYLGILPGQLSWVQRMVHLVGAAHASGILYR